MIIMGFHNGTYATIWDVEDKGNYTKVQMSTSSKNKDTGHYETDWSDFASFVGGAHKMASDLKIKKMDRIKIVACDEKNRYDKAKGVKYYNHVVFEFEPVESRPSNTATTTSNTSDAGSVAQASDEDPF